MERHYVTVVFSDLSDSVPLAQSGEPEVVARIQSKFRQTGERVADAHGGVVNQHYGDGMLVVFGLPQPKETDTRRAIEFALTLHQEIDALDPDSALPAFKVRAHTGVAAGLVVVERGGASVGVYEVVGEALNLAARLSDSAPAGEIHADAALLGPASRFFDSKTLAPMQLKGMQHPTSVVRILRALEPELVRERFMQHGNSPFAGRDPELARLSDALALAETRTLRAVNISGPPGLGKTRLVEEFLQTRVPSQWQVLRAHCDERLRLAPMQTFLEILGSHLSGQSDPVRGHPMDQALEQVPAQVDGRVDVIGDPEAIVQRIRQQAEKAKLLIFVDDWQWTDDASRTVMASLIKAGSSSPILLVTTCRSVDPSDPVKFGQQIELQPLKFTESRSLINAIVTEPMSSESAERIVLRAGGNPLYIEEICQTLRSGDLLDASVAPSLPTTLSGLIEAKVAALSASARATATAAAIVGLESPLWVLEALCNDVDFSDLESQDIAYVNGYGQSLRFKHGLTREVVYSLVGLDERRRLHCAIAEVWLNHNRRTSVEAPLEILSYHYSEGGNHAACVHYATIAGDRALAINALDQARMHYQRVLSALEQLDGTTENNTRWVQVSKRWALASTYAPSRYCIQILEESLARAALLNSERRVAEANYYLGWIFYSLGDQEKSLEHASAALGQAQNIGAEKLALQLLANLGQSAAAAGDYPAAHSYLDQAIANIEHDKTSREVPIGWAYAVSCKAFVVADEGDFAAAEALMRDALASVGKAADAIEASIRNMFAAILLWQGRWQEAVDGARAVQRIAERFSLPYLFAMSQSIEAYASWHLDGDDRHADTLRGTLRWLDSSEMQLNFSLNCAWTAEVVAATGELREAAGHAQRALRRAASGDRLGDAMAWRVLARVAYEGGYEGLESPADCFAKAYAAAQQRTSSHEEAVTRLHHARYLRAADEVDAAKVMLAAGVRDFRRLRMSWHLKEAQSLIRN